ncbi:hypothetical protein HY250_01825 [Candidatus Azambacteria bacterium]|nr:hypothetical protein [Candidatus Azambacteria bacterium]MBI3685119.1 hypothetical protein [Candidatus Azambacteria bacterium]
MKTIILTAFFVVLCAPFVVNAGFYDLPVLDEWAIVTHPDFNKEIPLYEGQRFGTDFTRQIELARFLHYLQEDWHQTRDLKNQPGTYETNPILGRHPSDGKIDLYFAGCYMVQHFLATRLPEPYASSLLDSVAFTEHLVVEANREYLSGGAYPSNRHSLGIVFTSRF